MVTTDVLDVHGGEKVVDVEGGGVRRSGDSVEIPEG